MNISDDGMLHRAIPLGKVFSANIKKRPLMSSTGPTTGAAATSTTAGAAPATALADKEAFSCRMYGNRYPEVDDLVMVNVRQIAEMGAYVNLLEYNNVEGMVLLSELSRRRIRSVQKLIRVGRNEVVVVLRVDKEKGNRSQVISQS